MSDLLRVLYQPTPDRGFQAPDKPMPREFSEVWDNAWLDLEGVRERPGYTSNYDPLRY